MTDSNTPGFWESPISADMLATAGTRLGFTQPFGDDAFWDEGRPEEGGRVVVVSRANGDILPAPWSARTRVHEMGGLSWLVTLWCGEPGLLFCEASDQRLYWKTVGGSPVAITPASPEGTSWRYCDMTIVGTEVWCIRESDSHGHTTRALVAVNTHGDVRILDDDSHFYAHLALAPDGRHLAWIAWEHPHMPWDATQLRVASIIDDSLRDVRVVLGGPTESVQSPAWVDSETLAAISDRSGWWNPWLVPLVGPPSQLVNEASEWGQPLWMVGWRTLQRVRDGVLLAARGNPELCTLTLVDATTGATTPVPSQLSYVESFATDGVNVTGYGEAPTVPGANFHINLTTGETSMLTTKPVPVGTAWLPNIVATSLPGIDGRQVHVVVHEPTSANHATPSCAPTIITAHGGPTGHSVAAAALGYAYFTSRGFRIVDVNYAGSTGYGRAYRDALKGQWGVADTQDVISAAQYFADPAITPPGGMFIRGGSAGGFAVLNALVHSDIFDGGINYYGVADLIPLANDTHDFESRYLDSLIGPYPDRKDLYQERSPLTHAHQVTAPLLILQGADDPIVPPAQSRAFLEACQAKGIPCEYHEFAGESHGFRKADTLRDCAGYEIEFLQAALKQSLS